MGFEFAGCSANPIEVRGWVCDCEEWQPAQAEAVSFVCFCPATVLPAANSNAEIPANTLRVRKLGSIIPGYLQAEPSFPKGIVVASGFGVGSCQRNMNFEVIRFKLESVL